MGRHHHHRTHEGHPHYVLNDVKTHVPHAKTNFDVPIGSHPESCDLRDTGRLPPVYDQGKLGSCTANALAAAIHFEKQGVAPSRLFIYYNERALENDVADDKGACIGDGVKSLKSQGVCGEALWPYSDDKERFKEKPSDKCYEEAQANEVVDFDNVHADHDHLKAALASGFPIVMGIKLYDSFESEEVAHSGVVPLPHESEHCLGGHAIIVVGYDEVKQVWLVRNSWGEHWGHQGYFYLPYAYLTDEHVTSNLYIIKRVN